MEVDLTKLRETTDLLQTLMHRNQNQHRRSPWWKWAGILKRSALKLLDASETDRLRLLQSSGSYLEGFLLPRCFLYELPSGTVGNTANEDRGQHIKRTVLTDAEAKPAIENSSDNVQQFQTAKGVNYGSKPTGHSRRKTSNAIDDLFKGF
ncbi:MAG: hypothetical protein Q9167_001757 [Letrouitia subvulpina]